ncbi:MAG: hypothetical protein KDA57_10305 [Planctomycetales bacterium]|nr:hypothetical protein [Planctomycetales bacterium]
MFRSSLALVLAAGTLSSPSAFAQFTNSRLDPTVTVSHRYAPPEAIHDHSSTAYEGARRGEAAWMAAFGDLLLNESQAAYVWEHVESMRYDNKLKKTATALTRKRMLDAYREYEKALKRGQLEEAKQLWEEKYSELAQTYRLDEYQFNWATGAIYWPTRAASPRYAKHRQEIGMLIERIVRYGAASDTFIQDELTEAVESFRSQLRADAVEDDPSTREDYLAMQRYLVGLKYTPYLLGYSPAPKQLAMK